MMFFDIYIYILEWLKREKYIDILINHVTITIQIISHFQNCEIFNIDNVSSLPKRLE